MSGESDESEGMDVVGLTERLHFACAFGPCQDVAHLLAQGAEVNGHGRSFADLTPLHQACENGEVECARLLLEHGANPNARNSDGYTPLHEACQHGRAGCAKLVLEAGADVDAEAGDGGTPLHAASELGSVDCLTLLLSAGANVNLHPEFDWITPLHDACDGGHSECTSLLLEAGADANARDGGGNTPLHCACRHCGPRPPGAVECVRLLLKHGADAKAANSTGNTPLHEACAESHVACARLLLEAGADVDARNEREDTPLHWTCESGEVECTRLLLEAGANGRASTASGWTPSGLADDSRIASLRDLTACKHLVSRANALRVERGVPAGVPLSLDWTESTHRLLLYEDRRLLHRALGALLLVDARREGGATLGREGALAFVAGLARAAGV
jgi:ankyrin repeat protein